jgi:protein involved in polysaccharide export with SLBB domain
MAALLATLRRCSPALLAFALLAVPPAAVPGAAHGQGKEQPLKDDLIQIGDRLHIYAVNVLPDLPIKGVFRVEPTGKVALGPGYGRVMVKGLTLEQAETDIRKHLANIVRDPWVCVTRYDPVAEGGADGRLRHLEEEIKALREAVEKLRK